MMKTRKEILFSEGVNGMSVPKNKKHINENEPKLKGTFISVMLLGGFLVVSWIGAFLLFISRGI
ncbi:cytochrome c oxidase subunit 2A [Oceanobacillus bengalensis]